MESQGSGRSGVVTSYQVEEALRVYAEKFGESRDGEVQGAERGQAKSAKSQPTCLTIDAVFTENCNPPCSGIQVLRNYSKCHFLRL